MLVLVEMHVIIAETTTMILREKDIAGDIVNVKSSSGYSRLSLMKFICDDMAPIKVMHMEASTLKVM